MPELYLLKIANYNYVSVIGLSKDLHYCNCTSNTVLYERQEAVTHHDYLKTIGVITTITTVEKERKALILWKASAAYKNQQIALRKKAQQFLKVK
mgnify:FL=1